MTHAQKVAEILRLREWLQDCFDSDAQKTREINILTPENRALQTRVEEAEAKLAEMVDWFRKFSFWVPKEAREHDHVLRDGWKGVDRGSLSTDWVKEADAYAAVPSQFPLWQRMADWQRRVGAMEKVVEDACNFWRGHPNRLGESLSALDAIERG